LQRIRRQPDLVRAETDLHPALRFYRVSKHLIVCDVQMPSIVVLTVIHASMDIPRRLAELQPTLATEVAMLHQSLRVDRN
jgi:plasmid stabilization system protein ParE